MFYGLPYFVLFNSFYFYHMDIKEIIIDFLKKGLNQKQISEKLVEMEIKPNSLSSVEKYLNSLRKEYRAETMFHLGYILYQLDFQS